jgi:MFS family permease
MTEPHNRFGRGRPTREAVLGSACAVLFAVSLGISALAIPLIASAAGLTVVDIGVIVTIGAAAQLASRFVLPALTTRLRDQLLIALSGGLLALSCILLAVEVDFTMLVIAQIMQGAARAIFWTSSQTHAVRTSRSAVSGLAPLNFVAGVGQAIGPLLAGVTLGISEGMTMGVAAAIALAIVFPALIMASVPPTPARARAFRRQARKAVARQNAHVIPARRRLHVEWASAAPGGWRALLGSYVPIVLKEAGHTSTTIGLLVSLSGGASVIGSVVAGRAPVRALRILIIVGCLAVGVGLAGASVLVASAVVSGCLLALSGFGAGLVQTVGPAAAAELAGPEGHTHAIIRTGTYRAAALTLAPIVVAVLAGPVTAAYAVAIAALVVALPGTAIGPIEPPGSSAKRP